MYFKEKRYEVTKANQERLEEDLSDWTYPTGIVDLVLSEPKELDLNQLKPGALVLAAGNGPAEFTTVAGLLKTLLPYASEMVSFPASKLLRLIKKNFWSEAYEKRFPDVVETVDVLGVFQTSGLIGDELPDLDRWIAVRGVYPGLATILMGDSCNRFKVTIEAYKGRIITA